MITGTMVLKTGDNMKKEEQVCSVEEAGRLKELGVLQDGIYSWCLDITQARTLSDMNVSEIISAMGDEEVGWMFKKSDPISAFTVSDLLDRLPSRIQIQKSGDRYDIERGPYYVLSQRTGEMGRIYGETAASALAQALIYFIENNIPYD